MKIRTENGEVPVEEALLTVELNRFPRFRLIVNSSQQLKRFCEQSVPATLVVADRDIPIKFERALKVERIQQARTVLKEALTATVCHQNTADWLLSQSQYAASTQWQAYQRNAGEHAWAFFVRAVGGAEPEMNVVDQILSPDSCDGIVSNRAIFLQNPRTTKLSWLMQILGWLRKRSEQYVGFACRPFESQGISLIHYGERGADGHFGIDEEGYRGWHLVPTPTSDSASGSEMVDSGPFWKSDAARHFVHWNMQQIRIDLLCQELLGTNVPEPVGIFAKLLRFGSRLHLVTRTEFGFNSDRVTSAKCLVVPLDELQLSYPSLPETPEYLSAKCDSWNGDKSLLTFKRDNGEQKWQRFERGNEPTEQSGQQLSAQYHTHFPPYQNHVGWYAPPQKEQVCEIEVYNGLTPRFLGGPSHQFPKLDSASAVLNTAYIQLTCSQSDAADQEGLKLTEDQTHITNDLQVDGAKVKFLGDVELQL